MNFGAHTARIIDRIGIDVLYTPYGGSQKTIKAVFSAPPKEFLNVEGVSPMVSVKNSDVPTPKHDDGLVVNAVAYRVIGVNPDAVSGITTLDLEATS